MEQTQHLDGSSSSEHDSFLITGRRHGDRLMVDSLQPFSRRSKELRRAVRAIRQSDVCDGQSVIVDLGRPRTEAGRGGQQTRRRPRKHRGETTTMETTTTTSTVVTSTEAPPPATNGGRSSRNRQRGSRRNRGRNREAKQRARASRRERKQRQGRNQ